MLRFQQFIQENDAKRARAEAKATVREASRAPHSSPVTINMPGAAPHALVTKAARRVCRVQRERSDLTDELTRCIREPFFVFLVSSAFQPGDYLSGVAVLDLQKPLAVQDVNIGIRCHGRVSARSFVVIGAAHRALAWARVSLCMHCTAALVHLRVCCRASWCTRACLLHLCPCLYACTCACECVSAVGCS